MPLLSIGCGGDDDTPEPTSNTLDKDLLYDKRWRNEAQTLSLGINKDGTHGVNDSWEWVNNSDTMRVDESGSNRVFFWVFNKGNTENEMEAKLAGDNEWTEFRVTW